MNIDYVGLGNMGSTLSRRLVLQHHLTMFDLNDTGTRRGFLTLTGADENIYSKCIKELGGNVPANRAIQFMDSRAGTRVVGANA